MYVGYVVPRREKPILACVFGGAAPPPRSVRQSRTPASQLRINGSAVINISAEGGTCELVYYFRIRELVPTAKLLV